MGVALLNDAERKALILAVGSLDRAGFDGLVYFVLGKSVEDFNKNGSENPLVLAKDFATWLTSRPADLVAIIEHIRTDSPNIAQIDILTALAKRVKAAVAVQLPKSFDAVVIDAVYIANRAPLRENLRRLTALGMIRPIVIVSGGPQSGRSHSSHLIQLVALDYGIAYKKVDLEKWVVEQRTLDALYDELLRALDIEDLDRPQGEGVTPETLGQLYAGRLQEKYKFDPAMRRWIVFDSTDRSMAQEIASFLRTLCALRLNAELQGCTFFLLGDGAHLSFDENTNLIFKERLSRILPNEVADAARSVNDLGVKRLDEAALGARVAAINAKLASCSDEACGKAVSESLNALRLEVEA